MDGHRRLRAWQDARLLALEIYAVTRALPQDERFVSVPQLRRAAWSVANNIAEGNARRGRAQLSRFLNCAIGSLGEVDSMMGILPDLYSIEPARVARIDSLRIRVTREVFRMMRGPGR